ncbi:MAG: trypsin-like peptidase domain-containing protein [Actinomycetota bacterium]
MTEITEPWVDASSPDRLDELLATQQDARVELLLDSLIADLEGTGRRLGDEVATRVLTSLKHAASFPGMRRLGDAIVAGGQTARPVLNLLARAELEHGELTRAIDRLYQMQVEVEGLLEDDRPGDDELLAELSEICGSLGRVYKQIYVDAAPTPLEPRTHDLDRALHYYRKGFDNLAGDRLWHGINIVALLTHARRVDRGDPSVFDDEAMELAGRLLAMVDEIPSAELRHWNVATKAEAHLARGEYVEASEAVQSYLVDDGLTAFAAQSTLRQWEQIWMLDLATPPGSTMLPLMRARVAEQSRHLSGDEALVTLHPEERITYEKVLGDTGFQPVRWLRDALVRATGVVLLGPEAFEGHGTGFVIEGSWLGEDHAGRPLIITNAHVCTNDRIVRIRHPDAYPSGELVATFLGLDTGPEAVELRPEVVWSSPPEELDATIVELAGPVPAGASPPQLRDQPLEEKQRAYVIGYPGGRATPQVSLQDNEVHQVDDVPFVRYRTPTEPGSSGSPVFDERWRLAALHHAYEKEYHLNEGLMIDRVLAAARAALNAP